MQVSPARAGVHEIRIDAYAVRQLVWGIELPQRSLLVRLGTLRRGRRRGDRCHQQHDGKAAQERTNTHSSARGREPRPELGQDAPGLRDALTQALSKAAWFAGRAGEAPRVQVVGAVGCGDLVLDLPQEALAQVETMQDSRRIMES